MEDQKIHLIAKSGNFNELRNLINEDPHSINLEGKWGKRPLQYSAEIGSIECVRLLLENGADSNPHHKYKKKKPIHLAVTSGSFECVETLIDYGADVNDIGVGRPPLHDAVRLGLYDCSKLLIENGADVNALGKDGMKSIHHAALSGSINCVKLLIKNGADIHAKSKIENNALHYAALGKSVECISYLLRTGIDINCKGICKRKPIHLAAAVGSVDCIRFLIENGADVDANDNIGVKPLYFAAKNKSDESTRLLIENGANVNAGTTIKLGLINTALGQAVSYDSIENARLLLEKGAEVNAKFGVYRTSAIFFTKSKEMLQLLVNNEAMLNIYDTEGKAPLDYAIQDLNVEVVEQLIHKGAVTNLNKGIHSSRTLMQLAVGRAECTNKKEIRNKCFQNMELLLKGGADPKIQNKHGDTVLHDASLADLFEFVELLLRYDANPSIRNISGYSCFDLAEGNPKILELFKPYKENLDYSKVKTNEREKIKYDSPEELINRLLRINLVKREELISCTEKEITELESNNNVKLPESYKRFLRIMGNGAGSFLKSDHWDVYYSEVNQNLGTSFFKENHFFVIPDRMSENLFVFATRLGEYPLAFVADGRKQDPPIYGFDKYDKLTTLYDSFWGFIQNMVEYYEHYK